MEVAPRTKRVRGFVELRGPDRILGWAWRSGDRPLTVVFTLQGEILGECRADRLRPGLARVGIGDGRVGFDWAIPEADPPIDPASVQVAEKSTGTVIPDEAGLKPVSRLWSEGPAEPEPPEAEPAFVEPPPIPGYVEARGPEFIAGWAQAGESPVTLVFSCGGQELGRTRADRQRENGCVGFAWRLPFHDPPIDPADVEVREAESGGRVRDAEGVTAMVPPPVRGWVEERGPVFISGWAKGAGEALRLEFVLDGERLGGCVADILRQDLADTGVGDGRAAFRWRLPFLDPPVDVARIEVRDEHSGVVIPDAAGLRAVRPRAVRGWVEERGPGFVSGWARGVGDPLRLEFVLDGERLGGCLADGLRQDLIDTEVADGRAGFRWRLPFRDPPVDVARLEVRDKRSGAVIPDASGVRVVQPKAVRGWVEERGPDVISGWAKGPGGPVTLAMMVGEEVMAEIAADQFRESLLRDGLGDGRAGFEWRLPLVDSPLDPAKVRVVEVGHGIEIPDVPGLAPSPPIAVRGMVEECSYRLVRGWAWNGRPGARLEIEIVQDGEVIGTCTADRPRRDLARSGLDDGRHGFSWIPPRGLEAFDASRVQVRARPSGTVLPHKPLPPRPTGLKVSDLRVEAGWLVGRLSQTAGAAPPRALDLVDNDRFLLQVDLSDLVFDDQGSAGLEIDLPRRLFGGRPHRLTLHEPGEGRLIGGQDRPLVLQSAFNSLLELLTPQEIRGWVVDPDDPDGQGKVELREGGRLIRAVGYSRERPEVARDMGVAHAFEFAIRRLPLTLFDGEEHELSLTCAGRPVYPHKQRRLAVRWSEAEAADISERFEGAVAEVTPLALKGYAIDHLSDRPLQLEIRVDGEVVARPMADRYVAALKDKAGHGFHGFDVLLPGTLMNGRRRKVEVRPAGTDYILPPGAKPLVFPLVALGESPPALDPPQLDEIPQPAEAAPALLSLIVLNLDGAHVLEPFLRSVAETRFRDEIEIVLIDHGSTDESREVIDAYRPRLRLTPVYRGENHSFSASCNLGAVLAKGEHLVFVNNDIVFRGDALAGMRDILDARPEVGLAGLRLLEPRYRGEGRWEEVAHHTGVRFRALVSQDKTRPRLYHPIEVEDGGDRGAVVEPAATAALCMVRKADFRAVGGFDEAYHYGYEDVDLALRLRGRLGKVTVCRLDAAAVHNRSATREAKLVAADAVKPVALSRRDAHANLEIFTRRFSRHLPRLILRQLAEGGEAWRSAPLRISFVVAESGSGPEADAARALGRELRDRFGWEPMLLAEDARGGLARTDVLVSLRPGYELRKITDAAPGLVTVAWPFGGPDAWEGRDGLYHLRLDLPPASAEAARALRKALLELLEGPRRRIAVKAQADNEPHAHALAEAFARQGHLVRLDGPRHWPGGLAACDELVVALAGMRAYEPFAGAVNVLCVPPGVEPPDPGTKAAFDRVLPVGDPDADAAAIIALYEGLRREFLGGLAG